MTHRSRKHYWAFLFEDFLSQTDPVKLHARLGVVESAITKRMRELDDSTDSDSERAALHEAEETVMVIKVNQLGFPSPTVH